MPKKLFAESDVVVVAEVTKIKIVKERARIEPGFGNYDWAIYLTLRVQEVEKRARGATDEVGEMRASAARARKVSSGRRR